MTQQILPRWPAPAGEAVKWHPLGIILSAFKAGERRRLSSYLTQVGLGSVTSSVPASRTSYVSLLALPDVNLDSLRNLTGFENPTLVYAGSMLRPATSGAIPSYRLDQFVDDNLDAVIAILDLPPSESEPTSPASSRRTSPRKKPIDTDKAADAYRKAINAKVQDPSDGSSSDDDGPRKVPRRKRPVDDDDATTKSLKPTLAEMLGNVEKSLVKTAYDEKGRNKPPKRHKPGPKSRVDEDMDRYEKKKSAQKGTNKPAPRAKSKKGKERDPDQDDPYIHVTVCVRHKMVVGVLLWNCDMRTCLSFFFRRAWHQFAAHTARGQL